MNDFNNLISEFKNEYDFLDLTYISKIEYNDILFPSVLHCYVYHKTKQQETKDAVMNAESTLTVANINKRIEFDKDWFNSTGKSLLESGLRDKFRRSKELQKRLIKTADKNIVYSLSESTVENEELGIIKEINSKTNKVIREYGNNLVGKLLMSIRDDLNDKNNNNTEVLNWVLSHFSIINDTRLLPEIEVRVSSVGEIEAQSFKLNNKAIYFIGSGSNNDIVVDHISVSRKHAILICDQIKGLCLVDLNSKSGTRSLKHNIRLLDHKAYNINKEITSSEMKANSNKAFDNKFTFALCTKQFYFSVDTIKIDLELKLLEKERIIKKSCLEFIKPFTNSTLKNIENESLSKDIKYKLINILKGNYDLINADKIILTGITRYTRVNDLLDYVRKLFGKILHVDYENNRNDNQRNREIHEINTYSNKEYNTNNTTNNKSLIIKFENKESLKDALIKKTIIFNENNYYIQPYIED